MNPKKNAMPWGLLLPAALLMALLPLGETPHLVEKLGMLFSGTLNKPIDVFDLFLHGALLGLLTVRGAGWLRQRLWRGSGAQA
jgi:hypothetical protein